MGPLDDHAVRWVAVLEAGPRAYLDGDTALIEAGLKGFDAASVRVSVPRGAKVWRVRGVDIRQTRRFDPTDVSRAPGIPRSREAVAAVRAALWARTEKEAALALTMAVQQNIASAEDIGREMLRVRRDKRRAFIHGILLDLLDGAQALSEIDVARECRRRGLPQPTRQVVRKGRRGRYYLDVYWEQWGLVVEIDGIHHSWVKNIVGDAVRHNDIALSRDLVLRVPVLGLRLEPETFFGQIEQGLRDRGWRPELPWSA
jgi:very-short-patch-repair endonuclease